MHPNDAASLAVGDLLAGKYRLERLVGKGGMGAVYAAHHELLRQRVAIKLLLPKRHGEDDAVARFLNEARATAKIRSEHVVRVLDVGILPDARPFLVMEYLEGEDLAHLLDRRRRLPSREAVDYVLEAIDAVAQAHALGIVHRDLKPSNLFLAARADGGRTLKVLDFGIAKALGEGAQAAVTTQGLLGSPAYMAPEYIRSAKAASPRSDMWALGVILYELLTGELPFRGANVGEILVAILESAPVPIIAVARDVPAGLATVVERCLRREASERFADLADLAEALAPYATKRAQSIARIRTTMTALRERPKSLPAPPPTSPDAPTAIVPPLAVQTNDSWTGAPPTVRRRREPPSAQAVALAAMLGVAVAAAITAVFVVVRSPATPASHALALAQAPTALPAAIPPPAPRPSPARSPAPIPSPATMPSAAPAPAPTPAPLAPAPPPRASTPAPPRPARPPPPAPTITRDRF